MFTRAWKQPKASSQQNHRKIPKISPGAYIFQRPLLRSLILAGLIFGGAYLRREICVSKLIGLAWLINERKFTFLLCFPSTSPRGAYIWRGLFSEFYGIRLTQCCTQFKSPGVKILCVLYLLYNVAFTFKLYGNS